MKHTEGLTLLHVCINYIQEGVEIRIIESLEGDSTTQFGEWPHTWYGSIKGIYIEPWIIFFRFDMITIESFLTTFEVIC